MPSYAAPIRDLQFVLNEVLDVAASDVPGYGDLAPDFTAAILDEAGKIAHDVLAPLNARAAGWTTAWSVRRRASRRRSRR
jgi:hypothetical protein